jgi:acetyl-CoA carboxylase carboxyl transferase subunit alpha
MAATLKSTIIRNLKLLLAISTDELLERRYQKFRRIGDFEEQVTGGSTAGASGVDASES